MPGQPIISVRARDEIIGFEVGSRADYEVIEQHPTFPGGASGVTIGFGYDLGYHTDSEVEADWSAHFPRPTVARLCTLAGLTGSRAMAHLSSVRDIVVPWDAAAAVYADTDIPRTIALTLATFPNVSELPPDSFGALVSLVFNRGSDCSNTPHRQEMFDIHSACMLKTFRVIPQYIRSMKRLWRGQPGMAGLIKRREAEAVLFEDGLAGNAPIYSAAPIDPADALDDKYNPGVA